MFSIYWNQHSGFFSYFYSILFYPITLGGRRGTTDEFATIPFHLDLFSAALVELAKSIPVHSLILSSHLFFCLPLFLFLLPRVKSWEEFFLLPRVKSWEEFVLYNSAKCSIIHGMINDMSIR